MANPSNFKTKLTVKLSLKEKLLGVKAEGGDPKAGQLSGEVSLDRGTEITLVDRPIVDNDVLF